MASNDRVVTEIEGQRLELSNLDKVLYPEAGFTKADVISYYTSVAPVMLPHLEGRPLTLRRFPDGVEKASFYEKNARAGAPEWLRTVEVPRSTKSAKSGTVEYVLVCDLATVVWAANLASLELHVPMWRAGAGNSPADPTVDLLVIDLDPGAPATVVECCQVAGLVAQELDGEGLRCWPKTSGKKGLQLYARLDPPRPWREVHEQALELARRLEHAHPDRVISSMRRGERAGKVLIDWSQNSPAKTTIAPYSLRAEPWPTVSTPLTWEEVEHCASSGEPDELRFLAGDLIGRVEGHGDLFAGVLGREIGARTAKPRRSRR